MLETENTNQLENEDFLEGLMSEDFSETEKTETEEETAAEGTAEDEHTSEEEAEEGGEQAEQTQQEEKTAEEMFPRAVEFQGQQLNLTMSEAVKAIQRGMGYYPMRDKLKAQVADLQKDPRILFVNDLAKKAGVTAEEYIAMQNNQSEYQALIDEYGDIAAVPPSIMEKFNRYSQRNVEKAKTDGASAAEKAFLDAKADEYIEFMENHPEFTGEIPQAVMEMVGRGETLEGAYARHRVAGLEEQLAQVKKDFEIYKTNQTNKNSRLPDVKSRKKKENDDFLSGFLGGF